MSLDTFTAAYITCALWSSTYGDEGEHQMDDGEHELAPATEAQMKADCEDFYTSFGSDIEQIGDDEKAGHDFWLTRNGHGAGFWDRGLGELGARLTAMSKPYGSVSLYIGDDGLIYA